MTRKEIIDTSASLESDFITTLKGEKYQLRGILNSEALLIIAVAEYYGVKHIIESGRARGHSTNLLAKYFTGSDTKITSIDLDKHSPDAHYSEEYLKRYQNLALIYGDSFTLIKEQVEEDCVVFIDGPKGEAAIRLCSDLLKDKRVKAVLIHDLHQNVFTRNICELIFTNTFYSDDSEYVERFKSLDADCWEVMQGTNYAPYLRAGNQVLSYGHTLALVFNSTSPYREPYYSNYLHYKKQNRTSIKRILREKFFSTLNQVRLWF